MRLRFNLLLISLIISFISCQIEIEAKEFEENEIKSDFEKFIFKTGTATKIVLIIKNENINPNSYDTKTLTTFNRKTEQSEILNLNAINYYLLEGSEGNSEYILKFKNYIGGRFIIYNMNNTYPLKNFENDYNFQYCDILHLSKHDYLYFITDILEEDVLIDIYYVGDKKDIKIIKVSKTGSEKEIQLNKMFIQLSKDFKYKIEYNLYMVSRSTYCSQISFVKRKIINYKIHDELKLNVIKKIPIFFLLRVSDFDTEIIYSHMNCIYDYDYGIEYAELETENVGNWDELKFLNNTNYCSEDVYKIYLSNIKKPFLMIKFTLLGYFDIEELNYRNFNIFKIFQSFQKYSIPIISQKETMISSYDYIDSYTMIFVASNISNIRTFATKESHKIIYQKESYFFPYIILPTNEPYKLNTYISETMDYYLRVFFKEVYFRNDLNSLFDSLFEKKIFYFDINENYTLFMQYHTRFPIIYYTEEIDEEIVKDVVDKNFEKFNKINSSSIVLRLSAPFFLSIETCQSSYLTILLNKDDNFNIIDEIPNKYLISNKEYHLKSQSNLIVRVDEDFDSNINIFKNKELMYKLNKENPYLKVEFPNNDLIFISEKDTIINLYYNISELFFELKKEIITFPIDKKGEIMIVEILSYDKSYYYYAMDYGYDYYISPNTKRNLTKQKYYFIDDPYSKLNIENENIRYYLILFNKNINYTISFKKKYENPNNTFYYIAEGNENNAIISDLYYPNDCFTYELLNCENKNIQFTEIDISGSKKNRTISSVYLSSSNKKHLFIFNSKSKFIFMQKENAKCKFTNSNCEIEYFIPRIENNKISILISNKLSDFNANYTFILVEDNENNDNLMNKIDNECNLFPLINNEIKDINYTIKKSHIINSNYLYEELDYSQFNNTKHLLIRILSCENEMNICFFSKTKRIYLENLNKDEEEEFGVIKIEDFVEYKVTRKEYIFSYDNKNYLNNLEDIIIYVTVPKTGENYVGEFEVINPLMQNFTFKYRDRETIHLEKGRHVKSLGKYYFIFRNCEGVSFYVHNSIYFFPLNKINNYISETSHEVSTGNGLLYFTMNLKEDRYIYLRHNSDEFYLYSISDKTEKKIKKEKYNAYKIMKGDYIFILKYGSNIDCYFMINIDHFLIDFEKNKEIKVETGISDSLTEPTIVVVANLSKYNNSLFLVSESKFYKAFSCENNMDIENIIKNTKSGKGSMSSHIQNIKEKITCDPPYYNLKLYTTRFELVSEVFEISSSKNLSFQQNDTIAFTVKGNGYNLILSNQENLIWLDKMDNEFVNKIISNEQIQFKLKPNENIKTDLQIIILENEKKISIERLTNKEISKKIKYNKESKEIKYYINLSKNKYLINHFDYIGKLECYISKETINGYILEEILKEDDINLNLFDKVTKDNFELDDNKILVIKKQNDINSDLLITPLIHDFIINNHNSKYLLANKRYLIRSYMKIILEENSDAKIKVYDLNNTERYTIDNNNSLFANVDVNKSLILKSDKDVLIYLYHYMEGYSRIFEHPKNNNNTFFVLFTSDCRYNKLEYKTDFGFQNYTTNMELTELSSSKIFIPSKVISDIKLHKDIKYITYMKCAYEPTLNDNISGFYENSTTKVGSYFIEENKDIYINTNLDNNKKYIFYQIFECNKYNFDLYSSIDGKELNRLDKNKNFIDGEKEITFYLKVKDELLFNYYKTGLNLEKYNNLEKNEKPHYNFSYTSKDKVKIDILPKYKNIDFEFYFLMMIVKDNKNINNPLLNMCQMRKLILKDKTENNPDIIIKKIEYKYGEIRDNIVEVPKYEEGITIYSNVIGSGKIYEDIEEYIFIEKNIFSKPRGLSVGAIIGIVIGGVALILIIVFIILKFRKKNSLDLENKVNISPLTNELED